MLENPIKASKERIAVKEGFVKSQVVFSDKSAEAIVNATLNKKGESTRR